ncbi:MAG: hypothetical protein ABSD30_21155 [Candidatus Binatus sp.]
MPVRTANPGRGAGAILVVTGGVAALLPARAGSEVQDAANARIRIIAKPTADRRGVQTNFPR